MFLLIPLNLRKKNQETKYLGSIQYFHTSSNQLLFTATHFYFDTSIFRKMEVIPVDLQFCKVFNISNTLLL